MKLRLKAYQTSDSVVDWGIIAIVGCLAVFAVWPPSTDNASVPIYTYAVVLFAVGATWFATRGVINLSQRFLIAPLLLSIIGIIAFAHAQLSSPPTTTYGAGIIPLVICALPLFLRRKDVTINAEKLYRFLIFVFAVASSFHLVWQTAYVAGAPFPLISFEGTFTFLFLLVLTGFGRRTVSFSATLLGTCLSLYLRPSSTLFFCAAFALISVLAYWCGLYRILRTAMYVVVIAVLIGNVAIFADADVANYVYSIEPSAKESMLESEDNNEFRLGVITALREELASHSMLFGKFFSGDVDPDVSDFLKWWYAELGSDRAPIHSDFIGLLSQGGLAGYFILSVLFIGLAHLCIISTRFARTHAEERIFDAILVMEPIFMLYMSFNPLIQKAYFSALFFFLVPACVFTARGMPTRVGYKSRSHSDLGRRRA